MAIPETVSTSPMTRARENTIEVMLQEFEQLFNTIDPSPFHEKDLDHDLLLNTRIHNKRHCRLNEPNDDAFVSTTDGCTWTGAVSAHQRHQTAAARHFKFSKDCVQMLLHHLQTQTDFVRDFLITQGVAGEERHFLFARG